MTEEGSLSEAIEEDLTVEDEGEYFRIDALTSSGSPVLINSVKTWNVSKLDKNVSVLYLERYSEQTFATSKALLNFTLLFICLFWLICSSSKCSIQGLSEQEVVSSGSWTMRKLEWKHFMSKRGRLFILRKKKGCLQILLKANQEQLQEIPLV